MTSREHARRLMLILLTGDGAPLRLGQDGRIAGGAERGRDERSRCHREGRRAEDPADRDGPRDLDLITAYTWT